MIFMPRLEISTSIFISERENNLVDLHQMFDNSPLLKNNISQEERQRLISFITQKVDIVFLKIDIFLNHLK